MRVFVKVAPDGRVAALLSHHSHKPCKKRCGYGGDCVNRRSKGIEKKELKRLGNSQERGICEEGAKMDSDVRDAGFMRKDGHGEDRTDKENIEEIFRSAVRG